MIFEHVTIVHFESSTLYYFANLYVKELLKLNISTNAHKPFHQNTFRVSTFISILFNVYAYKSENADFPREK